MYVNKCERERREGGRERGREGERERDRERETEREREKENRPTGSAQVTLGFVKFDNKN